MHIGFFKRFTDYLTKVCITKEIDREKIKKWIVGTFDLIAMVFTIVFSLVPNAPAWERLLLFGLLILINLVYYIPFFKAREKLRLTIFAVSFLLFGLIIIHFLVNEMITDKNHDKSLSATFLPAEYKPLPVKVSNKKDKVDFYCSDMPPVIDVVLTNQEETVATIISVDLIINNYEEFSPEEIVEHTWINDDPSELIIKREEGLEEKSNQDGGNVYKPEFIQFGNKVYCDSKKQELFIIDRGMAIKDTRLTIDRYSYLRIQPEIKDSGHYTFLLSFCYIDEQGQKDCRTDEIEIYYIDKDLEDILGTNDKSIGHFFKLGNAFGYRGSYSDAFAYYEKALSLSKKLLGEDHQDTATIYDRLAEMSCEQGNYEAALKYACKALDIREKVLGKEHQDTAGSNNNIANVYQSQGKYEEALKYYGKALEIYEKVLGEEHPNTATAYNNIAAVHHAQGKYEEALKYYEKALEIREKLLGEEHLDTAATFNNIAGVYHTQGKYEEALKYYEKALEIREKLLGEEHPATANAYNNLAEVYSSQGKYEEALKYYEKALEIREKVQVEDYPARAEIYSNLAAVYSFLGKYDEELMYYGKALEICEKVLGEEHPSTAGAYNNIAVALQDHGQYQEALKYCEKASKIYEKILGEKHSKTAATYANLAVLYDVQGEYEEALRYYGKALDVFEEVLGKEHPDIATTYFNMGILFYSLKEYEKAEEHIRHALSIYEKILGNDHPYTKGTRDILSEVEQALKQ